MIVLLNKIILAPSLEPNIEKFSKLQEFAECFKLLLTQLFTAGSYKI